MSMGERGEALMRIPIGIITGVIIWAWAYLICVFVGLNFAWTLVSGHRIRDLAQLTEIWNTQKYRFVRYISFLSNERPFPFTRLGKSISSYRA